MPGDDEFKEGLGKTPKENTNPIEEPDTEPVAASAEEPAEDATEISAKAKAFEPETAHPETTEATPATGDTVTVQPVQFASFEDLDQVQGPQNQNLNILLDIKLQLTVELGRTELPIKKVLELTKGSIVTLNKAAGEPVELYANGKLIAYGEVVVIEDNFGLRITHITDPAKRLHSLGATGHTADGQG